MFAPREALRCLPAAIVALALGCSSLLGLDDVGFDDSDGGSQVAGGAGGAAGETGTKGGAAGSGGTNAAGTSGSGGSSLPPFECELPSATQLTHRGGKRQVTDYGMVGGGHATYYVTFADLGEGENCLVLKNGDNVEVAYKVDAPSPAPGAPRGNGPWKVRVNHQWHCDEVVTRLSASTMMAS